jgi:hypothetical protein
VYVSLVPWPKNWTIRGKFLQQQQQQKQRIMCFVVQHTVCHSTHIFLNKLVKTDDIFLYLDIFDPPPAGEQTEMVVIDVAQVGLHS